MDYHALSTDELRHQAFDKARGAHDVGFFWDLVKHLRASASFAAEDGSGGGLTGSISDAIEIVRELMGKDLGDDEPLLRAKFVQYLQA
ncbi:MAG: hypothetical protein JWN87_3273 [Frankiales bacterium]|jgi:hypothetical protein|nr:hypothetical protein [Frankiales bacterium]MCW2585451.1 hypothetical protein [Frankiales bacterium]